MRLALVCLLVVLLCGVSTPSRAELRHYSSWLVDGGGRETLDTFAVNEAGELFVQVSIDANSTLGQVHGSGRVIAKLSPSGEVIWARRLVQSSSGFGVIVAQALAGTHDGGCVVTGGFNSTANFGGGSMTANGTDIFLLKFGADGTLEWQKKFGLNQIQTPTAIGVDSDGDIILVGMNALTVDFGGGIIRSNGAFDAFIAKLSPTGGHIWSRGFGQAGSQEARSLAIGPDGKLAVAFRFYTGFIDFGNGPIVNLGEEDVLAAVFDKTGALQWSRHAGGLHTETAVDAAFDGHGNTFVCGNLTHQVDLGGGPFGPGPEMPMEGFVASYDSLGALRWSYLIPDTAGSSMRGVEADAFGNCFALGWNRSAIRFGLHEVPLSFGLLLVFEPNGVPLDARGYPQDIEHRCDTIRDRVIVGTTLFTPYDFGGGILEPVGTDVVMVSLGLKRPAQVTISRFLARETTDGVELTWGIQSAESLGEFIITRQIEGSSISQVLYTSAAKNGEATFIDRAPQPGRVNTYRLIVTTALGDEVFSAPTSISLPGVANALEQNAPNPFNPLTTFAYSLAQPAHVAVVIYDTRGAIIARLDQGQKPAGRHKASWGGHNMRGEFVASGVYYYKLEGVPGVGARKMVLLK